MISGWSVISPYGLGRADFAAGVREGRRPAAYGVPDFDVREAVGRKGTRTMDRVTAFAVAATAPLVPGLGEETALVLGTNVSSVKSSMDFARATLTEAKPFFVDAGRFPNAVLNCAAAQCGIRHTLKGPNATVSGGRASGLLALNYARRLLRSGRASGAVLCGAAEEYSVERSWVENGSPLGEGAAMFRLDRDGGIADVLALEFAVSPGPDRTADVLERCVRRAFDSCGEAIEDLWLAVGSGGDGENEVIENLGDRRLSVTELVGDAFAASSAFGIAAVLALAEAGDAGRTALVTATDRDGVVGCALLRVTGEEAT